jgi:hypothetical protein
MTGKRLDISNKKKLITIKSLLHPKGFKSLGTQFLELSKQADEYMEKYMSKTHAGINIKDTVISSEG